MALLSRSNLSCAHGVRPAAVARPAVRSVVVRAQQAQQRPALAQLAQPAMTVAVANLIMAMPAGAEAGKLFDFDLTLPVMAGQFLLLMVFLDKAWFSPVGKVLDERDAVIRNQLSSVKGNTSEIDAMAAEAQEILKAARSEVTQMINGQKIAKQTELDNQYNAAKAAIAREVEASIAAVEAESKAMLSKLDAQVDKVSTEVLRRVLPEGVSI